MMREMVEQGNEETLDLIWGAANIAKFLNLNSTRQAFWFLENGNIPARKVGNRWVASHRVLKAHFEGMSAK